MLQCISTTSSENETFDLDLTVVRHMHIVTLSKCCIFPTRNTITPNENPATIPSIMHLKSCILQTLKLKESWHYAFVPGLHFFIILYMHFCRMSMINVGSSYSCCGLQSFFVFVFSFFLSFPPIYLYNAHRLVKLYGKALSNKILLQFANLVSES